MVIRIDDNTKQELIGYSQDKIPLHDSFSFHFFACVSLVCINRAKLLASIVPEPCFLRSKQSSAHARRPGSRFAFNIPQAPRLLRASRTGERWNLMSDGT